jgi:hypothetical protein
LLYNAALDQSKVDSPFIEVMMSLGCKLVLVEFSAIALTKGIRISIKVPFRI